MILIFQDTDANGNPLDFSTTTQPRAGLVYLTPYNPPSVDGNDFISGDTISASFTSGTASFLHAVPTVYCGEIVSDWGSTPFKLDLTTASGTINAKDYRVTTFHSIASASWARFASTASYALNASGGSNLVTGSTVPITASYALIALSGATGSAGGLVTGSTYPITASWALNSKTASYVSNAVTASNLSAGSLITTADSSITGANNITASGVIAGAYINANNLAAVGGGVVTTDANGRLGYLSTGSNVSLTASWAVNVVNGGSGATLPGTGSVTPWTASWAQTASVAITSSRALTASVAPNYLPLAGGTVTGNTTFQQTLSIGSGAKIDYNTGGSWLDDASSFTGQGVATGDYQFQGPNGSVYLSGSNQAGGSIVSASTFLGNISGSNFGTASWAINTVNGGSGTTLVTASTYPITASWAVNARTASSAPSYLPLAGGTVTGQTTFQQALHVSAGSSIVYDTGGTWSDAGSGFSGQAINTGIYQFQGPAGVGSIYFSGSNNQGSTVSASFFSGTASYALAGGSAAAGALVTGSNVPITSSWASQLVNAQPYVTLTTSSNNAFTASFAVPYQKVTLARGGITYTITSSNHPVSGQAADTCVHIVTSGGTSSGSAISLPAAWDNGQAGAVTFITGSPGHVYLWLYAEDTNFVSTAWRF